MVLVMILVGVWASQNVLFGDDKVAYNIMVTCLSNFKDPASLRLVSGTLDVDKDFLLCGYGPKTDLEHTT